MTLLADKIRRVLDAEPAVELAVLFGSAARAQMHGDSDVDVAVIGPGVDQLPRLQVALERATERQVDLVSIANAPPLLRFEIARDGILLLERTPHVWSDVKARAMVDWWDWAPTALLFQRAAADRLRRATEHGQA